MELIYSGFLCCDQCSDTWGHFSYGDFHTDDQYYEYIDSDQVKEAADRHREKLLEFADKNNLTLISEGDFYDWKFVEREINDN